MPHNIKTLKTNDIYGPMSKLGLNFGTISLTGLCILELMVNVFSNVVEICTNYLLLLSFFFLGKIMVLLRRSQMKIRPKGVQEYHDFQLAAFVLYERFRISSKSFHAEKNQYEQSRSLFNI